MGAYPQRKWCGATGRNTLILLGLLATCIVTIDAANTKYTEAEYNKLAGSERDAKLALQKSEIKLSEAETKLSEAEAKHRVKDTEQTLQLDAIRSLPSSLMSQIKQHWYGTQQCLTHDRSDTCSQGLQQHNSLGAGITWFTSDAADDDHSPGIAFNDESCALANNCSPAKCAGSWQNNTALYGDMDCENGSAGGNSNNKGSSCLDNLSAGAFLSSTRTGYSECVEFDARKSQQRITIQVNSGATHRAGTISKMMISHQHKMDKKYGFIAGKRISTIDGTSHVFKVGLCIKCPGEVFRKKNEGRATSQDYSMFYRCCIKGKNTYTSDTDQQENCPPEFTQGSPKGAFTAVNEPSATLKEDYKCTSDTIILATEAMIKAF